MEKITDNKKNAMKPFLKWAGGKGQLLKEIENYYPFDSTITKYAEPFVGGGAVLFDILKKYSLEEIYICDINKELINTYKMIKEHIDALILTLTQLQNEFLPLVDDDRKSYYSNIRNIFNKIKIENNDNDNIKKAALMIFLNKTCFNGLYRVNKKGLFNVPMGSYKHPLICDEINLRLVSENLQNIKIICGDYKTTESFIDNRTFVYFDPPYRPLNDTACFTSYTETCFSDKSQIELAEFIKKLDLIGAKILLSNSDPKNTDESDAFFDILYSGYKINRVEATRMINSNAASRGKIKELLISNF